MYVLMRKIYGFFANAALRTADSFKVQLTGDVLLSAYAYTFVIATNCFVWRYRQLFCLIDKAKQRN